MVVWELKDERGETGPYGAKRSFHDASRTVPARAESGSGPKTAGHRAQYADLLDAIATGRDPVINGEDARKPLEIIVAAYQSARSGREVALPLAGRHGE